MHTSSSPQHLLRLAAYFVATLLVIILLTVTSTPAFANTITVTGGCTLPAAIQAANTDIAFGGCAAGGGADLLILADPTYSLSSGVATLDGGLTATPSITSTITISSAGGAVIQRTGSTPFRLFHVGTNGKLTLNNVRLSNGYLPAGNGGAVANRGDLTLTSSSIVSNTAHLGGGIFNGYTNTVTSTVGSTVTLIASTLISNTAWNGGGLYNNITSTASITSAEFIANIATSTGGTYEGDGGGAIYNQYSTATIDNSIFQANQSKYWGGAIYTYNSSVALADTDFIANKALRDGGGVYNFQGDISITNADIFSNTANISGGGFFNVHKAAATLTNVYFRANSAGNSGGAFFNGDHAETTLIDSDIFTNTATTNDGGGIYNSNVATVTVTNSDFFGNWAGNWGGAIINTDHSDVIVTDSTLVSNSAGTGGGLFNYINSTVTLTGSDILSNTARTGSGGGLYNDTSTATLIDSNVSANKSDLQGGGIINLSGAVVTLLNSDLTANRSISTGPTAPPNGGGGLYNLSATAFLTDSQVSGNTSSKFGGGIYNVTGATLTLAGSSVLSNTASIGGGGLYNGSTNSTATITDTEVSANGATYGAGLYNDTNAHATLTNSKLTANQAGDSGGGIYNESLGGITSTVTLINSDLIANTTQVGSGAGISNRAYGLVLLINSNLIGNVSGKYGGGIFNFMNGTAAITNSAILSNTATFGGGVYNYFNSTITFNGSNVSANKAIAGTGGGLYNQEATATVIDSAIVSNSATTLGGGLLNYQGTVTFTGSDLQSNTAGTDGGGIYNQQATAKLNSSNLIANSAGGHGGGLYNKDGASTTIGTGEISGNSASGRGGGLFNRAALTITDTKILTNSALVTGSALYQELGLASIDHSCIVDNIDTAVKYVAGSIVNAANNWWGASNGPAGVGPGVGDSVSANVDFSNFQTSAILNCAARTVDLAFTKSASPSGNLIPGQPLTYTVVIANQGSQRADQIVVTDLLPAAFVLAATTTSGPVSTVQGSSYVITQLLASEVVTIKFVGAVTSTLTSDQLLSNTATLTSTAGQPLSATVSNNVVVPALNWSSPTYNANETSGSFPATLNLAPNTPYTSVTVTVIITNIVGSGATTSTQQITFPPSSGSQPVVVPIADDKGVKARSIQLGLRSPLRAKLGNTRNATIAIVEDDVDALVVDMQASRTQAMRGDSIVYTYHITNTGNVTLTIAATDDRLGTVTGLAGQLAPGAKRSATLSYQVQPGDPAGPLANTVTVIGTDSLATTVQKSAGASVQIIAVLDGLTVRKIADRTQASEGDVIVYTYSITNTGNVTLTVTAADNRLGLVGGLAGPLLPGASREATLSYTVKDSDPQGPLVNTVTVTGTDRFGNQALGSDDASVNLVATPATPVLGLEVTKSASRTEAGAGDTIIYTYQITNTGNVTLTIVAGDDRLGAVAGLAGQLAPAATMSTTLSYTVKESDPIGPLVNTVTVTGTDSQASTIEKSASATVTITASTNPPSGARLPYILR